MRLIPLLILLSVLPAAAFGEAVDPGRITLPSHYPDDPLLRRDWAAYLDSVRLTDQHVGLVMDRLRAEGLAGNTLVIFMTDHGISHARGKQFLYDEGTHIPFIVSGPGVPPGTVRNDLVESIDMAAITLAAAGLAIPGWMQGRDVLAENYEPRDIVFAARDRCVNVPIELAGRVLNLCCPNGDEPAAIRQLGEGGITLVVRPA